MEAIHSHKSANVNVFEGFLDTFDRYILQRHTLKGRGCKMMNQPQFNTVASQQNDFLDSGP